MAVSKQWKIAGAAAVVAGFGVGGLLGAVNRDGAGAEPNIRLQDPATITSVEAPEPVAPTEAVEVTATDDAGVDPAAAAHDDSLGSLDGESIDSPLQSADDSPEGGDSVATPDDPAAIAGDSVDGDSVDSPVAASGAPAPAPAADASVDSPDAPDVASVDSPDGSPADS